MQHYRRGDPESGCGLMITGIGFIIALVIIAIAMRVIANGGMRP